ncbi:MAG TPA: glutathione S-transferase family protein [Hyphomicrobiaceae bacterium]|jgi:glutathione S-transferase|nr:glutathione S-transferase family protein [Hyphomicrobiaceae bacterium]
MKIYGDLGSGNCLKVKYTADKLGLAYDWVPIDTMKGETRTPDFLARFPMARIPGVEFPDGRRLAESNAIIRYLGQGTALLPDDGFAQAKVDEWLFWEQYSHEPYVAVCRFHMVYLGRAEEAREPWRVERGEAALDLMERSLAGRTWLAGETMTVADIALLPYTRLAHEGGFDLSTRSNLRGWIERCENGLGLGSAHA